MIREYYPETTGIRYQCQNCGQWVIGWHNCPQLYQPPVYQPAIDNEQLKRIADALEKLVELLNEHSNR